MRVLYWVDRFAPSIGGLEVQARQLISGLQAHGHEFLVITSQLEQPQPESECRDGIEIRRFSFHGALLAKDFTRISAIAERVRRCWNEFRPDLLHIHGTCAPSLFFLHRARAELPTVLTACDPILTATGDSLVGRTLAAAHRIAAVSHSLLADIHAFMPRTVSRSATIPVGVAPTGVTPTPLPFSPPRLLAMGRLVPEKGFDLALRALAVVRRTFPEVELTLAGDGVARESLQQLAHELGLGDAVTFTGWIPPGDVPDLINEATVVVMPSRWREPFGMVAVQTAQMERPLVAAATGGLAEIVETGKTGLLVPVDDSHALGEAILALLQNPVGTIAMGQAARRRAEETYNLATEITAYHRLYQELAS